MKRLLFIPILHLFFVGLAKTQPVTVDDLLALSSLAPKSYDNYLNKKGFSSVGKTLQDDVMTLTFYEKRTAKNNDSLGTIRTVGMYQKDDAYCFILKTSSKEEWLDGLERLKKAAFVADSSKESGQVVSRLFQKKNMTVRAFSGMEEGYPVFTFLLEKRDLPVAAKVKYAEDLLAFDSHEYLISFFGKNNVKQDVYYFSEKELKKCSVIFPNSSHQAVFIWDDETNLCKLSYVLIANILPTVDAEKYTGTISENTWKLRNGIYTGMSLKELVRLNGNDFEFFGNRSEFSFMVVPSSEGNIDFKKSGLMLSCNNCSSSRLLDKTKVTAADAIENNLPLHIFYIMISR